MIASIILQEHVCRSLACHGYTDHLDGATSYFAQAYPQQKQKNCMTFVQRRPNVFDVPSNIVQILCKWFVCIGQALTQTVANEHLNFNKPKLN